MGVKVAWRGIAIAAALAAATAGHAELGGRAATVETDRAHFAARMTQASTPGISTYTLEPANGGELHEYANSAGIVFAIAWHGPGRPDLRQLLGSRFAAFQSDGAVRGGRRMRRHLQIAQPDLVIHSSGHPGAFFGLAYIPSLLPPGTTADDLR